MYRPMRERTVQLIMQMSQMLIGAGLLVLSQDAPNVMSPDQYGRLAYQVEAETWALLFMSTSLLYSTFIYINGRWRYSALLRLFSSVTLLSAHAFLGVSATIEMFLSPATFVGYPVLFYSLVFFAPLYGYFSYINFSDHRRRRDG